MVLNWEGKGNKKQVKNRVKEGLILSKILLNKK